MSKEITYTYLVCFDNVTNIAFKISLSVCSQVRTIHMQTQCAKPTISVFMITMQLPVSAPINGQDPTVEQSIRILIYKGKSFSKTFC